MGKSADRRRTRNASFMERLASNDPKRFAKEANKRIRTWIRATQLAKLSDDVNQSSEFSSSFGVADYATEQIARWPSVNKDQHRMSARDELMSVAAKAVAKKFKDARGIKKGR